MKSQPTAPLRLAIRPLRLLGVALLLLLTFSSAGAQERSVRILHTNDLHGHLEATDRGGLTRIATLVDRLRTEAQARPEMSVLLFDAGDTSLGTPLSGLFLGLPTAEIMASMGYDAVALGNHEFNWGKPALWALSAAFEAPVLCANLVYEDSEKPPPFPPYVVLERPQLRVGVVGLVTPETALKAPRHAVEGWRFLDPVEAAQAALAEMPEVDLLIALTHLGVDEDRRLAAEVPEFDLIVGGHSHTPLFEAVKVGRTPIVQSGSYARWLGTIELQEEAAGPGWRLVEQRLLIADESVSPSPEADLLLQPYRERSAALLGETVARLDSAISNQPVKAGGFRPLVKLVADGLRTETGAEVAVFNRGGVRSGLPAGSLSVETLHQALPFDDPVVILELSGADLLAALKEGLTNGRAHLEVSGVSGSFCSRTQRFRELEVAGAPLDPARRYRLAVTAFLAGGGDGMATLALHPPLERLPYARELFIEFARRHGRLDAPQPELRLTK